MNLENPNCIICGNNEFKHFLNVKCYDTNEFFSLKQCECSLVLTSPRPSINDIEKYYNETYLPHANANSQTFFLNNIFRKISYLWKWKLIKKYAFKENINLLDVGGGDGAFALYLKNKTSIAHMYDKNQECIDFMNEKDVFSTNNLEELKDNNYNMLTLFHSLEHIHEIDELFLNINRITSDKSRMIIAVPNINASEIKFLSNKWIAWDAPRHLYHFTFNNLNLLLEKYGWKIIKSKNMFQDTLFNIYMSLKGKFVMRCFCFSLLVIYSFITQIFFSNKQSTNLIICQKK